VDKLDEQELAAVLHYIEVMTSTSLPDDYDIENDPAIGFFTAEPDFASRTEEILQEGFGKPKP
jgi:hypothetical protein